MVDFSNARLAMVDSQLRTNKVTDAALVYAFETVPRELFVSDLHKAVAYVDEDLALNNNRAMLEPMVLARLIQELLPLEGADVLDLGCATGYASAILSQLAKSVVAADSEADLLNHARHVHEDLNLDNVVHTDIADIKDGAKELAPFDAILIGGGVTHVPQTILDQLAPNGRLITILSGQELSRANNPATRQFRGQAVVFERFGETISQRALFDATALPMGDLVSGQSFAF